MPYDRNLAERIRALVAEDAPTEMAAFGGLAFMYGGNMAVSAASKGGLMVHCAPERTDEFIEAGAGPMIMRGSPKRGWLYLEPDEVSTDEALTRWVFVGRDHARSLPPK